MKKVRLAILLTHPVQYFVPVFRELVKNENLDVQIFYGCDHGINKTYDPNFGLSFKWDINLTQGYKYKIISKLKITELKGLMGIFYSFKAASQILRFSPKYVLIFSYSPLFISFSSIFLKFLGCKLMLRAEVTDKALKRSFLKTFIRDFLLKNYYKIFDYFFPISLNSIDHYLRLGVSRKKMKLINYSIDVDFFKMQVQKWSPDRFKLRDEYKIKKSDFVLLYCAKIYPPKNPILIAEALSLIPNDLKKRIWLFVVGDGILREEFESKIQEEINTRGIFVGFKNQSELGRYYSLSDTLILPSKSGETWGLVVNEALQFGKSVVVSDNVGCARDLVKDSNYGYIFENGNKRDLANGIKFLSKKINEEINYKNLPHPKDLAKGIFDVVVN